MAKSLVTRIVFNGVDNVSNVIGKIQGAVAGAGSAMQRAGQAVAHAGLQTSFAISAPAAAVSKNALDVFSKFEDMQVRLATVTKATREETQKLWDDALKVAKDSPFGPVDVAAAQFAAATAGMNAPEILAFMDDFADGATVMGTSIEYASDALNAISDGFNGPIGLEQKSKELHEFNDLMAYTALNTAGSAEEIARALRTFGPIAQISNVDKYQAAGMIGGLAGSGFRGDLAGRSLRTMAMRLSDPAKPARAALDALGVNLEQFRSGVGRQVTQQDITAALRAGGISEGVNMDGLLNVANGSGMDFEVKLDKLISGIQDQLGGIEPVAEAKLRDALSKAVASASGKFDFAKAMDILAEKYRKGLIGLDDINKIFGKERAGPATALLKNWQNVVDTIAKSRTEAEGSVAQVSEGFRQSLLRIMEELKGAWEAIEINLVQAIAPQLKSVLKSITDTFDAFSDKLKDNPALAKFITIFAVLAATLGPVLIYVGLVAQGLGALMRAASMAFIPLTILGRAMNLLSVATMKYATRAGGMAVAALARMGVVGLAAAAVGALIYKSWGGLSEIFGGVLGNLNVKGGIDSIFAAFDDMVSGRYTRAWYLMKGAMANFGIAARDIGSRIIPVLHDGMRSVFTTIDSYLPAFSRFRDSVSKLADSLSRFGDILYNLIPEGTGSRFTQTIKSIILAVGDSALQLGSAIVQKLAYAIDELNAAVGRFRGAGSFFEGVKAAFDGLPDEGKLVLLGVGLLSVGRAAGLVGAAFGSIMAIGARIGAAFAMIGRGMLALRTAALSAGAVGGIIARGLLRFIPIVGQAILAFEIGRLIYGAFKPQIDEALGRINDSLKANGINIDWDGLAANFRAGADKLVAAFDAAWQGSLQFGSKVSESFFKDFDVGGAFKQITDAFTGLNDAAIKLSDSFGKAFDSIANAFGKITGLSIGGDGGTIMDRIATLIGKGDAAGLNVAIATITSALELVTSSLTTVANVVERLAAGDGFGALKAALEGIINQIDVALKYIDKLAAAFGFSLDTSGIFRKGIEVITQAFQALKETVESTLKSMQELWGFMTGGGVGKVLEGKGDAVLNTLTNMPSAPGVPSNDNLPQGSTLGTMDVGSWFPSWPWSLPANDNMPEPKVVSPPMPALTGDQAKAAGGDMGFVQGAAHWLKETMFGRSFDVAPINPGDGATATESLNELKNQTSAQGKTAEATENMRADIQSLKASQDASNGILQQINSGIGAIPGALRSSMPWSRPAPGVEAKASAPPANLPTTGVASAL